MLFIQNVEACSVFLYIFHLSDLHDLPDTSTWKLHYESPMESQKLVGGFKYLLFSPLPGELI